MNIITTPKKNGIIVSAVIVAVIGVSGVSAISNLTAEPKKEVSNSKPAKKVNTVKSEVTPEPTKEIEIKAEPIVTDEAVVQAATPSTPVVETPTNPHAQGSALAYVYDKRKQLGKFASESTTPFYWVQEARGAGVLVDNTPQLYDVCVNRFGYISFVSSINENGFVVSNGIQDMTYTYLVGSDCKFIH